MFNWIALIIIAVGGIVVGSFIGYMFYLYSKWKDKKNVLKNIEKQKVQNFIIPEKISNGKGFSEGKHINLKEYVGIKENAL